MFDCNWQRCWWFIFATNSAACLHQRYCVSNDLKHGSWMWEKVTGGEPEENRVSCEPCFHLVWTQWRPPHTWESTLAMNWAGPETDKSGGASVFWGGSGHSTSAGLFLTLFYESVVSSGILFAVVCSDSRLSVAHSKLGMLWVWSWIF